MASLMDKARAAVLGKLHHLLDEVANTPEAYRQRIRDLQEALGTTWAGVDEAQGELNGLERQKVQLTVNRDENIAAADELNNDDDRSNDEQAVEFQARANDADDRLAGIDEQIADLTVTRDELRSAAQQMEAKVVEMSTAYQRITLAKAATDAKNRAASAVEAAHAAASDADGADIDSIEGNIMRKKDAADARFDRVVAGTKGTISPEAALRKVRAVAALKARNAQIADQAIQDVVTDGPMEGSATS